MAYARQLLLLGCFCVSLVLPKEMAAADKVSRFDIAHSCRVGQNIGIVASAFASCMQREEKARDQFNAQWAKFPKADKTRCIDLCNCGGIAGSSADLLTCFQIAHETRTLPTNDNLIPSPLPNNK